MTKIRGANDATDQERLKADGSIPQCMNVTYVVGRGKLVTYLTKPMMRMREIEMGDLIGDSILYLFSHCFPMYLLSNL